MPVFKFKKRNKIGCVIFFLVLNDSIRAWTNDHTSENPNEFTKNLISSDGRTGIKTRDYVRYTCEQQVRIGGSVEHVKNSPHLLYRIDGAWFICLDGHLAPRNGTCNVISFGINDDFTFDEIMNSKYDCRVFSFDPYHEDKFFQNIRSKNRSLNNSIEVPVNSKWSFYK